MTNCEGDFDTENVWSFYFSITPMSELTLRRIEISSQ